MPHCQRNQVYCNIETLSYHQRMVMPLLGVVDCVREWEIDRLPKCGGKK